MTRLSMSDVLRSQEALIEAQRGDIERLIGVVTDVLAALTESRRPSASETVELSRAGTSGNPTVVKVSCVVQEGETEQDAYERAKAVFERGTARFPLPSGYAHPAPLGDENEPAMPPTLEQALEGSVKK